MASKLQVKLHKILFKVLARSPYRHYKSVMVADESKNRDEPINFIVRVMLRTYFYCPYNSS